MTKKEKPTLDAFVTAHRGISHTSVRRANAKTVLTVVAFNPGASNAEISRLSGLAPQTVSAILVDLESEGLIERGPVLRGRRGQPATPILLAEDGGFAIGVEVGWRDLDVIVLNMHAKVLSHRHVDYAYPDARSLVDTIAALVAELAGELTEQQRGRLLDLGIAMPGSIADVIPMLGAPQEQAGLWRTLDLAAALGERTGLSVKLYNDGNAGCWGELIALDAPRPANIIYLLVSHFVAAGIVGGGILWEGHTDNAAELGSMLVSLPGRPTVLAHEVASTSALRGALTRAGHQVASLASSRLDQPEFAAPVAAWRRDAAQALAQIIFNATTVVENPLVVVDTILSRETTLGLVGDINAELDRLPSRPYHTPRVQPGRLGALAPVVGAAELPLFRRHF